mgnify:FL=1
MKAARTVEEIDREIAETKAALADVHGTETEVYARIVGYYRAIGNWNKGKKDEFRKRKMFTLEDSGIRQGTGEAKSSGTENTAAQSGGKTELEQPQLIPQDEMRYEIYTRKTCPNCPPVRKFMETLHIPGRTIDVDTEEGLSEAARKGVFASPTVIFYGADGSEIARCHSTSELEDAVRKFPGYR